LKTLSKKSDKEQREKKVLLGLVDLYLKEGKPIGSNTLKEHGFKEYSSATLRNYFAKLEKQGFLIQPHASGGRIPSDKAFRFYAKMYINEPLTHKQDDSSLEEVSEISKFLHQEAEELSDMTHLPVFASLPVFEMDFIQKIRLIDLQDSRLLCVFTTDFGLIRTELLYIEETFSEDDYQQMEAYFYWRLNKQEKPIIEQKKVLHWAQRLYNELIVRYVVDSSHLQSHMIFKTGLSKLLDYPEFTSPSHLMHGLSIFENPDQMQTLLQFCMQKKTLLCLIGEELEEIALDAHQCSVLLVPYYINHTIVGAFALLGPMRLLYRKLFTTLKMFSETVSATLTKNVYKYRIVYKPFNSKKTSSSNPSLILLEDQSHV
jgi:heat-inducible transcriptional repressor